MVKQQNLVGILTNEIPKRLALEIVLQDLKVEFSEMFQSHKLYQRWGSKVAGDPLIWTRAKLSKQVFKGSI